MLSIFLSCALSVLVGFTPTIPTPGDTEGFPSPRVFGKVVPLVRGKVSTVLEFNHQVNPYTM